MQRMLCLLVSLLLCAKSDAQKVGPVGAIQLDVSHWTGITQVEGSGMRLGENSAYRVPDGPRGLYAVGLTNENDGTIDVRVCYGLRFDLFLDRDDAIYTLSIKLSIPPQQERQNLPDATCARTQVSGKGWHSVTVPMSAFDYNRGQPYFLKFIKVVELHGSYADAAVGVAPGGAVFRDVRFVRADVVLVDAPVRSRAGDSGETVIYPFTLTNTTAAVQQLSLALLRTGWEGFKSAVSPATAQLKPGESVAGTLRVTVPDGVPPGAAEKQTLVVMPLGGDEHDQTVEFTTLRRVPSPYLTFDAAGWQGVREKAAQYEWAKAALAASVKQAEEWTVDVVPTGGIRSTGGTAALFKMYQPEQNAANAALAWKLKGDKRFAEKAALFLCRMSDPQTGYPKTLHATAGDIPQEGGFFDACANAYDQIQDAAVLSDADKKQIEASFRLYVQINTENMGDGGISNWSVFNLAPAIKCALILQDMDSVNRLLNGPCGLVDQLRYGQMDDGWWYEVSLAYNIACATEYTGVGLSLRAFGNDFLHQQFPVAATNRVGLRPFEFQNFLGMAFGKSGPVRENFVAVKKFWDGITAYPDYRGVMFGMGDGHEQLVSGRPFELAYYAFREPAYAAIIKQGGTRDLLFGVPQLPQQIPEPFKLTAKSDNAGIYVLRSQTPDRPQREQIQATMKAGTHGSYHGHFDNVSLLSLMRYGRSFWNPETDWFGYTSYMYKWSVQASTTHNMVVVDGKMQEPQPCRTLLFYGGPMLQAVATETTARWSYPPYFGGYNQMAQVTAGDAPFVPLPATRPAVAALTGFTEPVRQRRLIVVTDDYVVIADDLKAERSHVFDNLLHLRGVTVPTSSKAVHEPQFDTNPLSSAQFITNVTRLSVDAPLRIESVQRIGGVQALKDSFESNSDGKNWETGGAKSLSLPGELHIDAHLLWPARTELAVGDYPESWPVNKKLSYDVQGDGRPLASGVFGAWILGSGNVDADVRGVRSLRLVVTTSRNAATKKTIFWTDAHVVTAAGKEILLADILATSEGKARMSLDNVAEPPGPGVDYEGGPIRVAGVPYGVAIPGEPDNAAKPCIVTIDLAGLDAVRFKAGVGGDWPVGNEEQLRRTIAVRAVGTTARFLTVLEPFESQRTIKSAVATGPDQLRVELIDGRVQKLSIVGFDSEDAGATKVILDETKPGAPSRQETAIGVQQ